MNSSMEVVLVQILMTCIWIVTGVKGKGSYWNKKAVELLIDELMARVKEDPDRRWPNVPYNLEPSV